MELLVVHVLVDDDSWSDGKSPAWADSGSAIGTGQRLMGQTDVLARHGTDSGIDVVGCSRANDHDVGAHHPW